MSSDTRKRVKLYALNAERQWDDKGTGHVSSCYVEKLKGMGLLVKAEADGKTRYFLRFAFQVYLITAACYVIILMRRNLYRGMLFLCIFLLTLASII